MELWHNPSCSKSRETKELLDATGVPYEIRRYLDAPPTQAQLDATLTALGLEPWELVRRRDATKLGLDLDGLGRDRRAWIKAMVENPKIIERPVFLTDDGRAAVGRPPTAVTDLLG